MITVVRDDAILDRIDACLDDVGSARSALRIVLRDILWRMNCQAGAIHSLHPDAGTLSLCAHHGIPSAMLERMREIPVGKGMAGHAASRHMPVQVYTVGNGKNGRGKTGGLEMLMKRSLTVPMLAGGGVQGTLGVAKMTPSAFSDNDVALLVMIGARVGAHLAALPQSATVSALYALT